jgi:hypothetical protein
MKLNAHIKRFLTALFLLLASATACCQQYPVHINAFLIPPYSVLLQELSRTGETKIQVQVLLTDMQQPLQRVRLKFSLENTSSSQQRAGARNRCRLYKGANTDERRQ